MFELIARYASTFVLHAMLGVALVLAATWLLYRAARASGWHQRGPRGPAWVAPTLHVFALLTVLLVAPLTGLQTGTVHALSRAIEHGSQELVLGAALEAGRPLGIESADQKLSLADAERLVTRWAPDLVERGRSSVGAHPWWRRAGDYWQAMPGVMREWIARSAPRTETTPRELVDYAWRNGAAPTVAAAKWQALVFAYGLAALLILAVAMIEWTWLAYTRRAKPVIPS